eukprot:TRINITY_DN67664_c11_g7_i1.p1 TRINITY_DN67664_c11_g7~~TRINITY_DN67664_c11_g7_i1.p1  ORF type:complete len:363 (-),score=41.25 TRINITY_DN67664_c11_g7_i1:120-1208(-)
MEETKTRMDPHGAIAECCVPVTSRDGTLKQQRQVFLTMFRGYEGEIDAFPIYTSKPPAHHHPIHVAKKESFQCFPTGWSQFFIDCQGGTTLHEADSTFQWLLSPIMSKPELRNLFIEIESHRSVVALQHCNFFPCDTLDIPTVTDCRHTKGPVLMLSCTPDEFTQDNKTNLTAIANMTNRAFTLFKATTGEGTPFTIDAGRFSNDKPTVYAINVTKCLSTCPRAVVPDVVGKKWPMVVPQFLANKHLVTPTNKAVLIEDCDSTTNEFRTARLAAFDADPEGNVAVCKDCTRVPSVMPDVEFVPPTSYQGEYDDYEEATNEPPTITTKPGPDLGTIDQPLTIEAAEFFPEAGFDFNPEWAPLG